MSVMEWGAGNVDTWLQRGRNAAQAGRTGEVLGVIVELFWFLINAAVIISRNQVEINQAINRLSAGQHR